MLDEDLPDTQTQKTQTSEYHPSSQPPIVSAWGRLFSCRADLETVDLTGPQVSLGRSLTCDIVIHKNKFQGNLCINISKVHFRLIKEDGRKIVFIRDLSKNGTFVNGQLVGKNQSYILQNGDVISIGQKSLKAYVYKPMNGSDPEFLTPELCQKYVVSKRLGKGACGEVYLAYEKDTLRPLAIKRITIGKYGTNSDYHINHPSKIQTEIQILTSLSNPFIIGMRDIIQTADEVFIVLDYMGGGELTKRILSDEPMTESEIKVVFFQIISGVQYLHKNGITHRDLKPENVLLSSESPEPLVKIGDFGLSKIMDEHDVMQTICGTPCYLAPEVIDVRCERYDRNVDIWSCGVILYYMFSKTLPFTGATKNELSHKIISGRINWDEKTWQSVSPAALDLLKRMLRVDPKKRINLDDIFRHRWIEADLTLQFKVAQILKRDGRSTEDDGPPAKRCRFETSHSNYCE